MAKRFAPFMVFVILLASLAPLPAAAAGPCGSTVTVGRGDTLRSIAARCGTTVSALLAANPFITNPNRIYAGQRLRVPGQGPAAQRISFAAGTTSAVIENDIAANATHRYVLGAAAGQQLLVDIENPTALNKVFLAIYGADGQVLLAQGANQSFFRGRLSRTQDYFVEVRLVGSAPTHYVMGVTIPERITFRPGGTSATVAGRIPANGTHNFVIRAGAGQTMTVDTFTTMGDVILIIYGEDGDVLARGRPSRSSRPKT